MNIPVTFEFNCLPGFSQIIDLTNVIFLVHIFFSDKHNLKVREHKILGPYVDGLSKLLVQNYNVSHKPVVIYIVFANVCLNYFVVLFILFL